MQKPLGRPVCAGGLLSMRPARGCRLPAGDFVPVTGDVCERGASTLARTCSSSLGPCGSRANPTGASSVPGRGLCRCALDTSGARSQGAGGRTVCTHQRGVPCVPRGQTRGAGTLGSRCLSWEEPHVTDAQPAWQRGKNRTRGDLPWLGARCRDDRGQSTRPREGPARWPQSRPGPSLQGSECHHRDDEVIRMPPEVSFLFNGEQA